LGRTGGRGKGGWSEPGIPIHRFVKGERRDPRVQALFGVLVLLSLQVEGFRNRQLRPPAQMLGLEEYYIAQGKMTCDLRRLRLHGLIGRIQKSDRYRPTPQGNAVVDFHHRTYSTLIRPALSVTGKSPPNGSSPEERDLQRFQSAIDRFICARAA